MCIFPTPDPPADPKLPPETAAMKLPDGGAVRSQAARRTTDRMRAGSQNLFTSGAGVTTNAPTASKQLLGQ